MADNNQDTNKKDTDQKEEQSDLKDGEPKEGEMSEEALKDETHEELKEDSVEESSEEGTIEEEVEEEVKMAADEPRIPDFRVGDTIRVFYKIIEGDKMRIQPFEGIVISFRGSDVSKTFTVRRIGADQVGVERIFPLYTPNIERIKVVKRGNVRRAKLYYLRKKVGREAMRVREHKK
ncbi:MAG: hypothetical protein KatS3mg101_0776 [Patescibacteria group bacterium]|nr:MAG: hypothetical protein KatS3mg101_0776 [Patescibacteria group bacterium]